MTDEPQPRKPARRRTLAIAGGALAVAAVAVVAIVASPRSSAEGPRPPEKPAAAAAALPIQVHVATPESYTPTVEGTGTLLPNEEVTLSAELAKKLVTVAVEDGQSVSAGQVLFELDTRDTLAAIARLRAQARYAKASYSRYSSLSETGAVSADERDTRRAGVDDVNAQLAELEVQLDKARIVAPFSGTFGLRPVSVGAWVTPGQDLGRLVDLSTMKLDFRLPERFVARVKTGQGVEVSLDALPGQRFSGRIDALDSVIDANGRSLLVRARLDNPGGVLKSGLFARTRIVFATRDNALVVPEEALVPQGSRQYLYKIVDGAGGTMAERLEARIGLRLPGKVEVLEGLAPGDRVVTAGQARLGRGESVPVKVVDIGQPGAARAPGSGASGARAPSP